MALQISDGKNSELKKAVQLEWIRICQDPIYFLRKYYKISHPIRGKLDFDLYPFQERVAAQLLLNKYNLVLKSRQIGLSTLESGLNLWKAVTRGDQNILIIATKLATARTMFNKVKFGYNNLPSWIKLIIGKLVEDNVLSIKFKNGSSIKAVPSTEDSGRSESLSHLSIDECLGYNTKIKIRNKKTGEIKEIPIGDLFEKQKFI